MDISSWFFNKWLSVLFKACYVLGPMLLIFWIFKPKWLGKFRIHQPRVVSPDYLREFPATIFGLSVYLLPLLAVIYLKKEFGYSKMYLEISEYGMPYFVFSIFLFAVIGDTYFYWLHRGMHKFKTLKMFHHFHHKSYNVTPLTSYSFHAGEAILNMLSYAFVILVIPFHPLALAIFGTIGMMYTSYIHLGFDIPRSWREKFPPLKIFYSSTQHSIHHQYYDHNFAVYFSFWDKVMKTEKLSHDDLKSS